jgi:hypothetical protein
LRWIVTPWTWSTDHPGLVQATPGDEPMRKDYQAYVRVCEVSRNDLQNSMEEYKYQRPVNTMEIDAMLDSLPQDSEMVLETYGGATIRE